MGEGQHVRYMVIARYSEGRRAHAGHRVAVFETAEEADVEARDLMRRSRAATAEVVGVDSTGRLTQLGGSR